MMCRSSISVALMITLRRMRNDEFPAYCDYFIADYAQEMVQNYGHRLDVALQLAEQDLRHAFPAGPDSGSHTLLCMEAVIAGQPQRVGYLWHGLQPTDHATFIYDIYVAAPFRGQGFGKQAIAELEKQLATQDIHQIKLRVAFHNPRALKLYQALGFAITGYNMAKQLAAD